MDGHRVLRRQPQQARSRETVQRIVAAGRAILARDGYDGLSTNRVAAEAGISPGSLYQYFADKGAIVEAIIDAWGAEVDAAVSSALVDRLGEEGPAMVRATANALVAALEANEPLLRVVVEALPQRDQRARRIALEGRVRDLLTAYLAARPSLGRPVHPATAAWVLVMALEQVAVRWVLDRPPIPRAALLDELVALSTGYLGVPPGAEA